MIRADGILRSNKATLDLIDTYDEGVQTGIQLLAKNPQQLEKSLAMLEALCATENYSHFKNIAAVDLNFGCPSPDVIREGAGPALLKRRKRILEILQVLVAWKSSTTLPNIGAVGCKIRLGLNADEERNGVYMHVAEAANQAGIDYLVVHARNAQQRSRDPPNWQRIAEVKAVATMPIIGNGDVTSKRDADRMMRQTGCDGVMLARAAVRNPWVFREFAGLSSTPTSEEVAAARVRYSDFAEKYNSKHKYRMFHQSNFDRLMRYAESGKFESEVQNSSIPKNSHLT
jgi:tRNA-dihydrouridine synthase B